MGYYPKEIKFLKKDEPFRILAETFYWWQGKCPNFNTIIVPRGFASDGASVPKIFWHWFPPWHNSYTNAAVIHDWFYFTHTVSRKRADKLMYEAMVDGDTTMAKRLLIYYAVRIGGRKAWYSHSVENKLDKLRWKIIQCKGIDVVHVHNKLKEVYND